MNTQTLAEAVPAALDRMMPVVEAVKDSAQWAATSIRKSFERANDYVRDIDWQGIPKKVEKTVRAHPAGSLMAAVAVGLLLGATLRRR